MQIKEILQSNNIQLKRALFTFNIRETDEKIAFKFNLWSRYFFPKYFTSQDCKAHELEDINRIKAYKGDVSQFVDIAFRGFGKTARTKLFIAYVIANDEEHNRRYFRCLSADLANAKQSITDIYNMFVTQRVAEMYPEIFEKTSAKREETMGSFTTATGIKAISTQIGVDQRGNIMEDARADFDWYDDIESKTTIRSAKTTKKIGENMEEARTGLAKGGSSIYTVNYFSEMGNVHTLVTKKSDSKVVQITPIVDENGVPTWERFSLADIEQMKKKDEDFEGERMCRPSASKDILFDRETLDKMEIAQPVKVIGDFKMFKEYDPSHRYAGGQDVAGGVGLDSSTNVIIDFDTIPCRVVATYKSNTIKPDTFGHELTLQGRRYGECLLAPEKNNHGHATIAILKQEYNPRKIHNTTPKDTKYYGSEPPREFGWHTNGATKPKMLFSLKKAIEDGLLLLSDKDLIQEAKSYSRDDLMDTEIDPRLTTRHFDMLVACAIAWQMKDFAEVHRDVAKLQQERFSINKAGMPMNSAK